MDVLDGTDPDRIKDGRKVPEGFTAGVMPAYDAATMQQAMAQAA